MTSQPPDDRIARIKAALEYHDNFPKPGVQFVDIFPLTRKASLLNELVSIMVDYIKDSYQQVDLIVGLDARGFIFGPLIAQRMNIGFVPIRKAGKLPGKVVQVSFSLEYGKDVFEIQEASIEPGQKVVIVDDLLATGGTMSAACQLVSKLKGEVLGCLVVIELPLLNGRKKISEKVHSIIELDNIS